LKPKIVVTWNCKIFKLSSYFIQYFRIITTKWCTYYLLLQEIHQAERDSNRCLRRDVAFKIVETFHNYSRVSAKETWEINCDESQMRNRTRRNTDHFETRKISENGCRTHRFYIPSSYSLFLNRMFNATYVRSPLYPWYRRGHSLGNNPDDLLFDPVQSPTRIIACIAVL